MRALLSLRQETAAFQEKVVIFQQAAGMMHYSVYVIGADGRISRRIDLHCATDDDAKQRAQLIACQHQNVELWQEARMISEFTRPQ
ncbi:hypothetical protein [Bradyrhizobium elkanii]|uniref:hypothetical protein n=1 Tax=Bradyrhizobium elkanii TaxID=29448 RepID=UPI0012BBCC19|nr:hypothetical protein [Bradyrhizobium elkanii]